MGSGRPRLPSAALAAPRHMVLSVAGGDAQVRVHTREGTLKPVTDVTLERESAQWPPKLTSAERADIMRPEALRSNRQLLSDRQLLSGAAPGARRRHLLVSAWMSFWRSCGQSRGVAHAQLPRSAVQPHAKDTRL